MSWTSPSPNMITDWGVSLGSSLSLLPSTNRNLFPAGRLSVESAYHGESLAVVADKVRREKALDFSGCNSRPGTGSLHPVGIETAAEATKLSELSMERVTR